MFLRPEGVRAYPEAVRAILDADLILAGPGSLFTSVLPNLLVRDIAQALGASPGFKLYVCNVATQPGETDGFDLGQHVEALERHVGRGLFPHILANDNLIHSPEHPHVKLVAPSHPPDGEYKVITADLVDGAAPWRHASQALTEEVLRFYRSRKVA